MTAWEAIMHRSLLLNGASPTIFGITLIQTINIVQTIILAITSVTLAYLVWIKK